MYLIYMCLIILVIALIICFTIIVTPQSDPILMNPISENTFPFPIYIINLDRKPERYIYVKKQLEKLGLTNYQKWPATDGFTISPDKMINDGVTHNLTVKGKGLAGCAVSHINIWKHIAENNYISEDNPDGWTLILEDDAHFHPQFISLFHKYWEHIPKDAKIIFSGYCTQCGGSQKRITEKNVMCTHGYMVTSQSAKYLLDNLLPINEPIDIVISNYFRISSGSYIFNGNVVINEIRPNDYKKSNGKRCMFDGIIYQNHKEYGNTIHNEKTVFE